MRKFACHRLYLACDNYWGQSVVTIQDDGRVISYSSLDSEIEHTEWLGGIIILSSLSECSIGDDFKTMLRTLTERVGDTLYAWHVSDFDFSHDAFTSQSTINILKDKS